MDCLKDNNFNNYCKINPDGDQDPDMMQIITGLLYPLHVTQLNRQWHICLEISTRLISNYFYSLHFTSYF